MTIQIASSPVQFGDQLYSRRANTMGTVVQVLDYAVVLQVNTGGGTRNLTVTDGGRVANQRDVFWNPPLEIDLPKGSGPKFTKLQNIVTALVREL